MSSDDELKAKGQILDDYAAAKTRLAVLKSRAARTAEALATIARGLKDRPTELQTDQDTFYVTRSREGQEVLRVDLAVMDRGSLEQLVADLRETSSRYEMLSERMKQVGAL